MNEYRILVVDDEEDLCEILQFNLELEGYKVDVAHSAEEALKLDLTPYSLILLDVMMGQISGFKMAQMLKNNEVTAAIPIVFLTARDTENDLITGFNLGADDYISKPFSIKEVCVRVKAVARRAAKNNKESEKAILEFETLKVDLVTKKVQLDGADVAFTKKEFELIKLFLENRNRVFSREEILKYVWSDEVCVLDRTVDVNITRIRKKIGRYGSNLVARLGYGYSFNE